MQVSLPRHCLSFLTCMRSNWVRQKSLNSHFPLIASQGFVCLTSQSPERTGIGAPRYLAVLRANSLRAVDCQRVADAPLEKL
jgi:hypothetical protein